MSDTTAPPVTNVEFLTARLGEDAARWMPGLIPLGRPDVTALTERMLADIEAKRAIIDLAEEASGLDSQVDSEFRIGTRNTTEEPYVGDLILRHLASVYSDHPDFDQEWKS